MRRSAKFIISAALAVVLGAYVFQFLNTKDLVRVLRDISLPWFVLSVACFLIYQWLRTLRLQLLVGGDHEVLPLFNTVCLHAFFNSNLPAGLGEAVLAYLLKAMHQVGFIRGSATVLVARFIDLLVICIFFFMLIPFYWSKLPLLVVIIMSGLLILPIFTIIWLKFFYKFDASKIIQESGIKIKLHYYLSQVFEATNEIIKQNILFQIVLYSILMWLFMYCFFFSTIYALGFKLPWYVIILLYVIIFPINILPIKGLANIGTHEAAWFISLQILGLDTRSAAVLGFGSHVIFFTVLVLTLIFPLYFLTISKFLKRVNNSIHNGN